jgi:hypothetical protein
MDPGLKAGFTIGEVLDQCCRSAVPGAIRGEGAAYMDLSRL